MYTTRGQEPQSRDHGAIAVITAILVILLFAVGALAVDIGNALSRKRQVQTTADFAALAGARELPSAANAKASAYAYLLNNATSGMDTGSWTPAQFDDDDFANGEIDVVGTDRVQVTAPPANVTFGLANAIGFSDTDVQAYAAAAIAHPARPAVLPAGRLLPRPPGAEVGRPGAPGADPAFTPASSNGNSVPDLDTIASWRCRSTRPAPTLSRPWSTSSATSSAPRRSKVYFTRGDVNVVVDLTPTPRGSLRRRNGRRPGSRRQGSVTQGTIPTGSRSLCRTSSTPCRGLVHPGREQRRHLQEPADLQDAAAQRWRVEWISTMTAERSRPATSACSTARALPATEPSSPRCRTGCR